MHKEKERERKYLWETETMNDEITNEDCGYLCAIREMRVESSYHCFFKKNYNAMKITV